MRNSPAKRLAAAATNQQAARTCAGALGTRASESAARAELDFLCGSNLTDMEWGRSRTRLLEFVGILREWDRKDQPANSVLGNVEVLCQRER